MEIEKKRLDGIDAMRLLGAFCVILLHISPEYLGQAGGFFRCFSRFAVPFFFVVSGFFYGKAGTGAAGGLKRIKSVAMIAVTANIVYFLWALGAGAMPQSILQLWVEGFSVHLWFLHSMLLGYVIIYLAYRHIGRADIFLSLLSVAVLGATFAFEDFDIFYLRQWAHILFYAVIRQLWSVVFMYGGILLARFEKPLLNKTTTFTLMMFGVALLLFRAEIYGLQGSPAVAVYLQMYLSLPLVIFSLFAMSYSLESGAAVCKAASLGRKYSLFIYLYHLPLIKIFIKLGDMLSGKKAFLEYHPFILAAGVFAATLIIAIVVDKMTPVVFGALTGKIAFNKVKVRSEYTVK